MCAAVDLSKIARSSAKGKALAKGRQAVLKRSMVDEGELSDQEDEIHVKKIRKGKDDGDLKCYKQRIVRYHATGEVYSSSSKSGYNFDGGLKVPEKLWKALYKYQKTGVKWLWELHCQQVGGILGDEMGLGKTIQIIVFLASLHHSQIEDRAPPRYRGLGPSIIIVPVTVMMQWVNEFHTWYPPVRVAILHATGTSSASAENLIHSMVACSGVIVTSYSTFTNHQDLLLKHRFHYVILDEGHKIRNPDAQITVCVKRVKTVHRLILSGSPIQNNLKELWSLYDFVFPGRLGMLPDFMEHFAVPITQGGYSNASETQVLTAYKCATVLRETISPYLIRRMKADVNEKQIKLPSKNEHVLFCRLTVEQRAAYKEYVSSREVESILNGSLIIFPGLIKLRKICNHPDLATGELRLKYSEGKQSAKQEKYGYYKRAGKLIVCKSLLAMWKKQGRKVLLFSQSTQMLDILESFVQGEKYSYLRMDGGTSISARPNLVNRFNNDKDIFVFLLTTRVGGLGVNLVGASRIIIYDPDWNPSTDNQARERAWRIGQTRDVIIYRLISTGSVEEKIYQRQIFKQFLTNKVLANPKQRRFFKCGDLKDLFTLTEEVEDEDNETQAIFAGTGSSINLDKVKEKAEMARKLAKQKAAEKRAEESQKKGVLWEMAKKLSEKIEKDKAAKNTDEDEGNEENREDLQPDQQEAEAITSSESKEISTVLVSETRDIINTGLFGNLGDLEFESQMDDKVESVRNPVTKSDAKCEGQRIPSLAKVRKFKRSKADDTSTEGNTSSMNDEEYILSKLLKKSLVNGAMKHDTIVDACNADYAIVEAEADKVAKQAAAHLKEAKKKCRGMAAEGQISWTGNNGGMKKPRFGKKREAPSIAISQKKSTNGNIPNIPMKRLKKKHEPATQLESVSQPKHIKVFNGSDISFGSSDCPDTTSADTPMSSRDLLAAMKKRSGISESICDDQNARLSENIRTFIASRRNAIGGKDYVETKEIISEFRDVPNVVPATFKAILKEICIFNRVDGQGRWTLKPDFA